MKKITYLLAFLLTGSALAQEDCNLQYDGNGDGAVNVEDVLGVLSEFGEVCEPVIEYGPCGPDSTVSYHGYDYSLVEIGDQCWFAENLRTDHFSNGDTLAQVSNNGEWYLPTQSASAAYEFDESTIEFYGMLYNGYAVEDDRGLCPSAWHVPTDGDYMILEIELGMSDSAANDWYWRGSDQGSQLKSSPTDSPAWDGVNTSGFTAFGVGFLSVQGNFIDFNDFAYFWSSSNTELPGQLIARGLIREIPGYPANAVYRGAYGAARFYSVRCMKD